MIKNHYKKALPLRALRIFEAAARHQNFTATGQEVGITQSAVSRKISELELFLEAPLFIRSGPTLFLTPSGKRLADKVAAAFEEIETACLEMNPEKESSIVTLSMLPSVAAKWFAPRLGQFTSQNPGIDLRISASRYLVDFEKEGVDGAIRYGTGNWPDLEATLLATETVQPVCAPSLLQELDIKKPADLLKAPLLHADIAEDWAAWFKKAGVQGHDIPRGPKLGDDTANLQAALTGQGVALGRSLLVEEDLKAGLLVAPFSEKLAASYSYWFVAPPGGSKSVSIVKDWIIQSFSSYLSVTDKASGKVGF
ncbi:MAG: transcriptional regulator GcvA [Sneathiellales bacterium]|nr:transcriptional regulator GcvA [Sneathiellales bacterium]